MPAVVAWHPLPVLKDPVDTVPVASRDDLHGSHFVRDVCRRQHPVRREHRARAGERHAVAVRADDADYVLAECRPVCEVGRVAFRVVDRPA